MNRANLFAVLASVVLASSLGGCQCVLGLDSPALYPGGAGGTGGTGATAGMGGTGGSGGAFCAAGETRECYSGPPRTEGIGECASGIQTCTPDGSAWGECSGQTLPAAEDAATLGDENCDGVSSGQVAKAARFGDAAAQVAHGVAVDPTNNHVVIVGDFQSAIQFGDDTWQAIGKTDTFIAKLDADGNSIWSRAIGGGQDDTALAVAVDGFGNIAVAGAMGSSVDLGGSSIGPGPYVLRLAPDGSTIWAKGCSAGPLSSFETVAIDGVNDVIVGGSFSFDLDCGDETTSSAGVSDAVVVKYAGLDGSVVWKKTYGNGTSQFVRAVAADPQDNVLVGGTFYGTLNFGEEDFSDPGGGNVFVLKLTPNGEHEWSNAFGDSSAQTLTAIAADELGGAAIAGKSSGFINFGGKDIMGDNVFIAKLTAAGSHAFSLGVGPGVPTALSGSSTQGFVVTGVPQGSLDFGGSAVAGDAFVAKLSSADAGHIWSRGFDNVAAGLEVLSAASSSEALWVVGSFQGTLSLEDFQVTSAGDTDVLVVKMVP